jgi:hypothetical protein
MKRLRPLLVGTLVFLVVASNAVAGTVIELYTETFGDQKLSGSATVYLEEKRMRIDSTEGGGNVTVIYNALGEENPFYWLIDHEEGSYIEIQKDDLVAVRARVEETMKEARKQIEGMPPDQKKQVEKMLADRMGYTAFFEEKTQYEKVSSGAKVGQWECTHYQGFREGVKIEEVWAADLGELGIDPEDLKAFEEMANLFKTVGQNLPAFFRFGGDKSEDNTTFPGFPVMAVSYEGGDRKEKSEIKGLRHEKLSAGLFALPEGLEKKEIQLGP